MARPTKLTSDIQKRVAEGIGLGLTYDLSCKYAGIGYRTFREWMDRGEQTDSGIYRVFYEAVQAAEGKAAAGCMAIIQQAAAGGQWQAAAWRMERRYPRDYGRTVKEVSGPEGGPVEVAVGVTIADVARELKQPVEVPAIVGETTDTEGAIGV